ncbi:MAG: heme lyase CcmF/NrfE family subunit [Gammaproteobacteria bacterium]|nr:MAG: heme lyase CcmF/NrfE family subunit [Gammaproteobacteria bacterium]
MWPELGHMAMILATLLALLLVLVPLFPTLFPARIARVLALSHAGCVLLAFAVLLKSFYDNDFSVLLVANNSHSLLPWYYRLTATWGNHEGSMLLWALVLSLWMALVAIGVRSQTEQFVSRVLGIMGSIAIGFGLFILLTSSPFERVLPDVPVNGADLNPLLQDFAMIVHPPTLYMGYVGLCVAFAFALAALWEGRLDASWAKHVRPWVLAAWSFLTIGIALGSWWAYYELGWGGWWFWDPVENASLIPWLVATALLHSLAVTERRDAFRGWTLLLAILAFALSLLGTFLVRSGVLTSVHAFAADPSRGLFILVFLGIVIGGALLVYALRAAALVKPVRFAALSRETLLLVNNVLLLVAAATVLLGTLFPLLMDALGQGRYSVGPPYFNLAVGPVLLFVVALLAIAPVVRWQSTASGVFIRSLRLPLVALLLLVPVLAYVLPAHDRLAAIAGVLLSAWVWVIVVQALWQRWRSSARMHPRFLSMLVAHTGVAVTLFGVVMVGLYGEARDIRLAPKETYALGAYSFYLESIGSRTGPNYQAVVGKVLLIEGNDVRAELYPEKRHYRSGGKPMTEAAILPGLMRDVYVVLGEPLDGEAWSLRVQVKPAIRWIWIGAAIMALGGMLGIWAKRRTDSGRAP